MSKILENKKALIALFIGFVTLLSLPLFFFILKFYPFGISNDISSWASFGDYLGGTMNTIISLLSLLILSYLTYLVSEQSNAENKKNNILMRRMDAYDEFATFLPEVNQLLLDFNKSTGRLAKRLNILPLDLELINKEKIELHKQIKTFANFYSFLFYFNVRFSHLFEYDFNSELYTRILNNAEVIKKIFEDSGDFFEGEIGKPDLTNFNLLRIFFDDLADFVNIIRRELI